VSGVFGRFGSAEKEVEVAVECEVVDVELRQSMSGKVAGSRSLEENGDRGRPPASFRLRGAGLAKKIGLRDEGEGAHRGC
jgi:hypothetical protein